MRISFLLISTCLSIILSGSGIASMLSEPYANPALTQASSSNNASLSFDSSIIEVFVPEAPVKISVRDLFELHEIAAEGDYKAQYLLGVMYQHAWQGADGSMQAPDPEKAVKYYIAAAVQGFAPAQNTLWDLLNQYICQKEDNFTQTSEIEGNYSLAFKVPEGIHKQTVEDIYRELSACREVLNNFGLFPDSPSKRPFDQSLCVVLKDFGKLASLVNLLNGSECFVHSNQHMALLIKMQSHPEINISRSGLYIAGLSEKNKERKLKYEKMREKLLNINKAFKDLSDRVLYRQKLSHEEK